MRRFLGRPRFALVVRSRLNGAFDRVNETRNISCSCNTIAGSVCVSGYLSLPTSIKKPGPFSLMKFDPLKRDSF